MRVGLEVVVYCCLERGDSLVRRCEGDRSADLLRTAAVVGTATAPAAVVDVSLQSDFGRVVGRIVSVDLIKPGKWCEIDICVCMPGLGTSPADWRDPTMTGVHAVEARQISSLGLVHLLAYLRTGRPAARAVASHSKGPSAAARLNLAQGRTRCLH